MLSSPYYLACLCICAHSCAAFHCVDNNWRVCVVYLIFLLSDHIIQLIQLKITKSADIKIIIILNVSSSLIEKLWRVWSGKDSGNSYPYKKEREQTESPTWAAETKINFVYYSSCSIYKQMKRRKMVLVRSLWMDHILFVPTTIKELRVLKY